MFVGRFVSSVFVSPFYLEFGVLDLEITELRKLAGVSQKQGALTQASEVSSNEGTGLCYA